MIDARDDGLLVGVCGESEKSGSTSLSVSASASYMIEGAFLNPATRPIDDRAGNPEETPRGVFGSGASSFSFLLPNCSSRSSHAMSRLDITEPDMDECRSSHDARRLAMSTESREDGEVE